MRLPHAQAHADRNLTRRSALVAASLALAGCAPNRRVRTRPLDLWPAVHSTVDRDTVPVRLEGLTGREELVVEGPSATLGVRRVASGLHTSDGRLAQLLRLDSGPHRIDDRLYPGVLEVVPASTAGGVEVQLELGLEDYVRGVVAAEVVLWSAQPAELEAQAIAARSYALATLARRQLAGGRAFLWDSVQDQAYRGEYEPGAGKGARAVDARLRAAIEATRGQVLQLGGQILDARFHAACGGSTARFADLFPGQGSVPIPRVRCEPCLRIGEEEARRGSGPEDTVSQVLWQVQLGAEELARLGSHFALGGPLQTVRPSRADGATRWIQVALEGPKGKRIVHAEDLRRAIGTGIMKSTWAKTRQPSSDSVAGEALVLHGRGRGHGVGLCQTGSREQAKAGSRAARILAHYYPGSRIEFARRLA